MNSISEPPHQFWHKNISTNNIGGLMSIPMGKLSEPFPPENIKQRQGFFGQTLDYINAATVIQRLNEVLEGEWAFTILDYRIDPDEVIVKGRMKVGGWVREQFGGYMTVVAQ